jgi:hypothetical protein
MNTAVLVSKHWFSPYSRISQVPVEQLQQQLCKVFECWGQPGAIRVDNGAPFGSPNGYAPPPLSLWLIGQGVNMIWNKPYRPTQHAKVEKLQDTTSRWAEVSKAPTTEELQQRLEQIVTMQREHYPVRRLEGKTRLQAFPALLSGKRPYRPADFHLERVWAFFHQCVYTRRLSNKGELTHFNEQTYIGTAYKNQWAQVRLAADGQNWEVLVNDKVVKTYAATQLTKERLQALSVYQTASPPKQT